MQCAQTLRFPMLRGTCTSCAPPMGRCGLMPMTVFNNCHWKMDIHSLEGINPRTLQVVKALVMAYRMRKWRTACAHVEHRPSSRCWGAIWLEVSTPPQAGGRHTQPSGSGTRHGVCATPPKMQCCAKMGLRLCKNGTAWGGLLTNGHGWWAKKS